LIDITLIAPEVLMRLPCQKAFLLFAVWTIACHDPTSPPAVVARFELSDINGRSLPTFEWPIPESPTIFSASLQLDASGEASLTQHRRQMAGGDVTYTSTYTYKITGNQIQFDYIKPCPPNALCVAPPNGTITESGLSLAMYGSNSGIVYNFRLVAPD
jgi:hypothetical protein